MRLQSVKVFPTTALVLLLSALPSLTQQESQPAKTEQARGDRSPTETLVIPTGTQIPLVLQNTVNTRNAQVGDSLYFSTIYPVVVNNRIIIPVGSFVRGSVTHAKRPGRIKGRGELHVRFEQLTLPNGYTVDLQASLANAGTSGTEEVNREEGGVKSDTTKAEDIATVATTTAGGAALGTIGSRGKGTAIGAGVGAAAGLAAVLLTRGRELVLPRGTTVEIALDRPLHLDPALAQFTWTGQPTSLPGPSNQSQGERFPIRRIPY